MADYTIGELKNKVLNGGALSKAELLFLVGADLEGLSQAANEIREYFTGNKFELCSIISGKGGACPEDCKFCSQGTCNKNKASVKVFPLRKTEDILEDAKRHGELGIPRYCIVSSGKALSEKEVDYACETIKRIKAEVDVHLCTSFGLLSEEQFKKLKDAGVERIHNNLETSERYFKEVCTTHTYEQKKETIARAKKAGLEICCGGIIGIGESFEDRIDMALAIGELDVQSVPINILNPVKGTPMENMPVLSEEEVRRTIAIYRFALPKKFIRLAAGRDYLPDKGKKIFQSGCNATITGEMLTVGGVNYKSDFEMLQEIGAVCE